MGNTGPTPLIAMLLMTVSASYPAVLLLGTAERWVVGMASTGHLVQPEFSLAITMITPGLGTLQAGLLGHRGTDCGLVPTPCPGMTWPQAAQSPAKV